MLGACWCYFSGMVFYSTSFFEVLNEKRSDRIVEGEMYFASVILNAVYQ